MGSGINLSEDDMKNAQELSEGLRVKANEIYIGVPKTRDHLAQVRLEIQDLTMRDVIEVDAPEDYSEIRVEAKRAVLDALKGNVPQNQDEFQLAKEGALVHYSDLIEGSYESRGSQNGGGVELLGLDYLSQD